MKSNKYLLRLGVMLLVSAHALFAHVVVLTWSYASNFTGTFFNVYRANSACSTAPTATTPKGVGWTALSIGNLGITHFIDSSVISGDSYCYYVTAGIPDSSESVPSNLSGATISTGIVSIAAPHGLLATEQ